MIKKLLYNFSGNLPCRLIDIDGNPYLERYFIGKIFGITFYLHRFVSADTERNVHDHPWGWAFALVLAGGYQEERLQYFDLKSDGWVSKNRNIHRGKINVINAPVFHRIGSAEPETYTLFVHGPRIKGWGFLESFDLTDGRTGYKTGCSLSPAIRRQSLKGVGENRPKRSLCWARGI